MKSSPLTITACFITLLLTCTSGTAISVDPSVPLEEVKQVTETLLSLSNTTQGQLMLKKVPIKKISSTSMENYASLNKLGLEIFYQEQS